jgi:outer membrane receptor protein involved in Fe transport
MKKIVIISTLFAASISSICAEKDILLQDTVKTHYLDEVVISSSTKETNDLKTLPASVSIITSQMIDGQKITSIKGLSAIIPNFFVADYGSKLSTPVYIRGIGERSTGQSIGMYVDNMPYMDKSVFDFDFIDIQRVEVLRGPQGTLYGRNAMSGIVNVFTQSALQPAYSKITMTGGNLGLWRGKAIASFLVRDNLGISLNLYGNRHDGYLTNQHTGEKADKLRSAGGRARIDWKINPNWMFMYTLSFDTCQQGAFPYGEYHKGKIASPSYNSPGSYDRKVWTHNLNLNYRNESVVFNSATGFLQLNDNMKMDNDYGVTNLFWLTQFQNERSWTEELTLKSNTSNDYQWSLGAFGFYNDLKTDVTTNMGEPAIKQNLQPIFDKISQDNPRAPHWIIQNSEIPIPGLFKTPSYGWALFHQSTYNNLFFEGMSITGGIRLDFEETRLDYNTGMGMSMQADMAGRPPLQQNVDTTLIGKESQSYMEILPKLALKYELNDRHYVYVTFANGYKAGGYNIQMFADVVRAAMMERNSGSKPIVVKDAVTYKPEFSWIYEAGFKGEPIKDFLYTELAVFHINARDIQITDFVESGQGRIVKNAGKARSVGFDLGLSARFSESLHASAKYGYTYAIFKDYKIEGLGIDYKGKVIPYAPQNTLSLGLVYNKRLVNKCIDRFNIQAQYNAAGRIYWTEANDVYQNFYGILNTKAAINKGIFELGVWTNNTLNTDYAAFYFKSMGRDLAQKGRPFTMGVDVSIRF